MTTTETRLLSMALVEGIHQALARLRFARDVDKDHPVVPKLPHPIDCDVCSSGRRVDMLIEEISKAIGNAPKVGT